VAAGDSVLGRGWKRERDEKGESKSAPKESRPIFHYECFHCSSRPLPLSMNQNADRRGRPTWRSKRKSVPSPISARRIGTSSEWAGCQPRNKPWALFLFSKTPTAPLPVLPVQKIVETPYLSPQTRLAKDACMTAEHGERFLPHAAPPHRHNPASHSKGLRVQRHLPDGAIPLAPSPTL